MDILDTRALQGEAETGAWPTGEAVPTGHEMEAELAEGLEGEFPGEAEAGLGLHDEQEYESEWEQEHEYGQREEFGFEDEQAYGAAESEPAQAERYEEYEDEDHEHDLGGEAGYETGYEGEFEGLPTVPVSTGGGRLVVQHLPLLKQHVGTPPDLVLGWNAMSNPGRVDVVVHLHGFSPRGRAMQLPRDMVPVSGLDFADPRHPATAGRSIPTLTVLPRGNFFGGRSGRGYIHSALHTPGALARLVDGALGRFGAHTGIQAARGRLILTAHSGGGASLMRVLAYADPDEVHTFDALYTDPSPLITWARARIARNDGGALRVLYREHEGTAANSGTVRSAVRRALAAHPATASARFRVQATPVEHMQIPPRFGWRLLADAGADVPAVRPAPSAPSPAPHEAEAFWGEAGAAPAPLTTEQLRQAWTAYYCAESRMVPIGLLSHRTPVNPLAVDAFRALARALAATGYQAKSTWVYKGRSARAAYPRLVACLRAGGRHRPTVQPAPPGRPRPHPILLRSHAAGAHARRQGWPGRHLFHAATGGGGGGDPHRRRPAGLRLGRALALLARRDALRDQGDPGPAAPRDRLGRHACRSGRTCGRPHLRGVEHRRG